MGERDVSAKIVKGWDQLAEAYQKNTKISTRDVHYGPLAYGEKRLRLLGDVKGKRTLEIGCGGGQNTIALARWGASAFGVDPSKKQIEYARGLAIECGVKATFEIAPAENLSMFNDGRFDIALSSHAFGYVGGLRKAYREVFRVLGTGGLFILCVGNPFYGAVADALTGGHGAEKVRDYLAPQGPGKWMWEYDGEQPVEMWGYARTLSQTINPLLQEGFTLEGIVEQGVEDVPHMSGKGKAAIPYLCHWSEKEFAMARKLPYSIILSARKQR